jgi:hypothetical protein
MLPDATPQGQARCSAPAQQGIGRIGLDIHSDIFEALTLTVSEWRIECFYWVIFKLNE